MIVVVNIWIYMYRERERAKELERKYVRVQKDDFDYVQKTNDVYVWELNKIMQPVGRKNRSK